MTPEMLAELATAIEKLRLDSLFDDGDGSELPPEAEAHYLLCLAALETAKHQAHLATYCLRQGR